MKKPKGEPERREKVNSRILATDTHFSLYLSIRDKNGNGFQESARLNPLTQKSAEVIAQQWMLEASNHCARLEVTVSAMHELSLR